MFLSTQEATSGTIVSESVGRHLFSVTNFLTRVSNEDIVSHVLTRRRELITKSFKLQPVVSKRSAHHSGVTGAPHLEGRYCHELTIFMTSTQLHMAMMKAAMTDPNHPALLNAPTLRIQML